jgi:ElaB/YqjD/DUF883 family membrane-anchored ribosome-binding protein
VPAPSAARANGAADDTQEIREQIERTREEMGRTIDELQDRLSPQHVMQQAKETVHEATVGRVKELASSAGETARETASDAAARAQDAAGIVVEQVRSHPVTAALIGAGIAWALGGTSILARRREPDGDRSYGPGTVYTGGPISYRSAHIQGEHDMGNGQGPGGWTDVLREHPLPTALAAIGIGYLVMQRDGGGRVRRHWSDRDMSRRRGAGLWEGARAGDARQAAGEMGDKVGEWSEQVTDGVRRAGEQARASADDITDTVQRRWQTMRRRTSSEFEDWMDESPLAVGAAALAAGLAIGFSTPRTRFEDEYVGPTRDALVERTSEAAEDAAQELKERVTR